MADGLFFFVGLSFFDPSTVLPTLLARLGASDWQIGLIRLILTLGFTLPALFAAHRIHGRRYHRDFLIKACFLGRIGLLTLPPALYFLAESRPGVVLGWLFLIYTIFWVMDGGCAVSWFDIVAKTIPPRVRGRFFGFLQTLTGLTALGAGSVVAIVLSAHGPGFPASFTLLAALWALGNALSLGSLFLLREPPGETEPDAEKPPFSAYARRILPMLRENPRVSRLILTRFLLEGGAMAAPFYALFAERNLGMPLTMLGLFVSAQAAGKIATGPLWGWLSDHYSPVLSLRAVAATVVCIPAMAILSNYGGTWLMVIVFFLLGAVQDGLWMVASTLLLESVDDRERPFVVGVSSICHTPASLFGIAGGVVAQLYGYPAAFAAALFVTTFGLLAAVAIPGRTRTLRRAEET